MLARPEHPKGLKDSLFATAEPILRGDGGCYVYLYTISDGMAQRAEVEKFLRDGNRISIAFTLYIKQRE